MIGIAAARPPYVEFKQVSLEDRNGSLEAGRRVTKNVNMAYIMQPGSRDQLEIKAEDWLADIKRKVLVGSPAAFPMEWVDQFHKKFEMWQQGLEAPLNGTSVKEWPVLSPAEVDNLLAVRIFTIEDLAVATEEALGRIGMGARGLRDKAIQWVKAQSAAEIELADLRKQVAELKAMIEQDKPKRGRPPKED